MQGVLNSMYQPFTDFLAEKAYLEPGQVLDVGCGTGAVTLAVAGRLGSAGSCAGIDISEPMLNVARVRAAQHGISADFIWADAQTHAFEPAHFDMLVSRFGVMFFDDPTRALTNLRCATRKGAALHFVVWRSPENNPFLTAAERAAKPLLPSLRAYEPDTPGPFAFANRSRVSRILGESGWGYVDIRPLDMTCVFPERELVRSLTHIGPVSRILQAADTQTRAQVIDRVRAGLDPYVHGDEVRFTAACWCVSARNQS